MKTPVNLALERDRYGGLLAALERSAPESEQLNLAVISASAVPFLIDEVERLRRQLDYCLETVGDAAAAALERQHPRWQR